MNGIFQTLTTNMMTPILEQRLQFYTTHLITNTMDYMSPRIISITVIHIGYISKIVIRCIYTIIQQVVKVLVTGNYITMKINLMVILAVGI